MGGGGEGGGRSTKKKFAQGKVKWKKILARQLILKKCSCYSLKKIHTRNLMTKKKFLRLENSPPHNFSNGPSLMLQQLNTRSTNRTVCLDLFAIYIMLSMSVKTNLHITVRTCQIERKNDCWLLPKRIVPRNNFFNLDGRALHFRAELLKAWLALTIG